MSSFVLDDAAWGSTWRHRSVRDKGVFCGGLLVSALLVPPWPGAFAVAVVGLVAMVFVARVPRWPLILSLPLGFIVIGAITVGVSLSWTDGLALTVTEASLLAARDVFLRAVAATIALLLLAATTPLIDILSGLRRLRIPDVLIDIAALVYRMVFLAASSAANVTAAQAGRLGYRNRTTTMRSASMAMAAVFVQTFDRAARMEAGFAGRGYVDRLVTLDVARTRSTVFVFVSIVVLAACWLVGWML